PTARAFCIATSSPTISCWASTARLSWSIGGWPRPRAGTIRSSRGREIGSISTSRGASRATLSAAAPPGLPSDTPPSSRPARPAQDVARYLADEPVSAYRDPWSLRARRWARKHRTAVTCAAAMLVVAFAALAVGLVVVGGLNRKLDQSNADLSASLSSETRA